MHRVIYVSRSCIGDHPDELDAIVERSSVRNIVAGITGMLWWDGANFVQVLEGPYDEISQAMARIYQDVRHSDIALVVDQAVTGRLFGSWAMKRSDASLEATANAAYLVGLAANDRTPSARRLFDVMLACDC